MQEKIHVQPSVHVDLVVDDPSEEILSEESLEEDVQEVFEVGSEESLEEFSGDASKEEPEDLDDEMVASLDINLMIEESLGLSQEESYEEEPSNNTNEDDSQQDQETQEVLILPNHEDQTPRIILDPPKTSVLVEEEESEETIDGGDEQSVIAVEAAVERRKLEQVEEVLLPEHQQVPIQESLVEEVPPVVPEFFEESEEQDIDSLESYEEDPDLEYSQDEESFLSQDEQKIAEPEDDFLSSIFNERDVQDLEVSASSRVSSIIVPVNEQKKVEEPLFVEQKSVDVLSEQVAGFEFSFDDSESERPVAQQTVQDSINAAFEKTNRDNISIDVIPGEQPRWMSAKSITANPHREDELGSGKWGEAQSNLDQDILQEVMSSTPVRELDLDDDGNGWALLLVGIVGLGLVILMLYGFVSSL